jgi:signal transduction histidine kinase
MKCRLSYKILATFENNLDKYHPTTIIGDADRLRQLFSNLVENTLRYADAPGILKIEQTGTALIRKLSARCTALDTNSSLRLMISTRIEGKCATPGT